MQETHEFVPIDIIIQFSQEVPNEVPKECHLSVECTKYGKENGIQGAGKHQMY